MYSSQIYLPFCWPSISLPKNLFCPGEGKRLNSAYCRTVFEHCFLTNLVLFSVGAKFFLFFFFLFLVIWMDPFTFRIGCKYFFSGYLPRSTNNQSVVVLPIMGSFQPHATFKMEIHFTCLIATWLVATALDSKNKMSPSLQKGVLYSLGYSICNLGLVVWLLKITPTSTSKPLPNLHGFVFL